MRALLSFEGTHQTHTNSLLMVKVLAIAHFCKGERLLKTFQELGCQTVLLSRADLQDKPWPRELVEEVFFVNDFRHRRDFLNAVSYLHQDRDFDVVAPLDEYAVSTCATVRAHLALPGLCEGTTRKVRDKLTMRCAARRNDIPVPRFCGFNNKRQIAGLMADSTAPWMVKPRSAGGSVRIHKLWSEREVWELWESLGDKRSYHLMEEFVEADVYHVDTVVHEGKVLLEVPGRYAIPPFDVWHSGGVFCAQTVPRKSKTAQDLLRLNRRVLEAMGIRNGVNHVEFLGRGEDIYFLEIAARVPGSNLDQLATASTGVDLYRESARLQYCAVTDEPYKLDKFHYREAGIVQCLAQQETPSLGKVGELPELTWTWCADYHVGVAFASPKASRIDDITAELLDHFRERHLAVLPASDSPA